MVELRMNEATGQYERPGPVAYGRVYKVIDQITGEIGYNCTSSDLPGLDPRHVKRIEEYDTFAGWVTEIISVDETREAVRRLNAGPREYVETEHTKLVARVKQRLEEGHAGVIDYHSVIDDMREMYADLMGRRIRPALPGWDR